MKGGHKYGLSIPQPTATNYATDIRNVSKFIPSVSSADEDAANGGFLGRCYDDTAARQSTAEAGVEE